MTNAYTNGGDKANQTVLQAYSDINDAARAFSEATMQSASAFTKGWDEITRSAGGIVQESVEKTVNASKTILSAKSVKEAIELQNEFVKEWMDSWMAGTGKITEISARVSKEVLDPVTQQVNTAMSKIMVKGRIAA